MSVHQRRFAAATRTAAPARGFKQRVKLTLTWVTVLAALSLFTFTVVGTAATTKPDVAGAAKKLPPDEPKIVIDGKHEVCSVNASQLAQIQARWQTGWMKVTVHGAPVDMIAVLRDTAVLAVQELIRLRRAVTTDDVVGLRRIEPALEREELVEERRIDRVFGVGPMVAQ